MSRYLRQGTLKFVPGYKLQTRWGRSEATVFALECAGAPLIAMAIYGGAGPVAVVTGLVMVFTAVILLLMHLGHPLRAWRAILNVRYSWISRGTVALGSVMVLGTAYLALSTMGSTTSAVADGIAILLALLGLFVGAYPGLVLSSSPAIAFWNSGLLPVLSLLQGASTAVLMMLAFLAQGVEASGTPGPWVAVSLLVALALALALYVSSMLQRGRAAAESARFLMKGHVLQFWLVVCVVGIGVPLALALWAALGGHAAALCAVAAIARLGGDFALRHAFLKVGMYSPVI